LLNFANTRNVSYQARLGRSVLEKIKVEFGSGYVAASIYRVHPMPSRPAMGAIANIGTVALLMPAIS
jgi:hypothetical protein